MAKNRRHPRRERKTGDKTTRLRDALLDASQGAPVAPLHGLKNGRCTCGDRNCKRPGKHPSTKLGIADATIDPEEIKRLWQKRPNARIGIIMGWPGKLLALVSDGQAGRATLRAITIRQGKLQRTVTIEDHDRRLRLFRVDGKVPHSREIADGVRILGDAELIIAPSTLSGSNSKRRFARGRAPGQVKIAKAPDWLLEIIAKPGFPHVACESDSQLVVTSAVDVPGKDVAWLWPGRIALGKLSVIAGHPGLGKSQLAAFLAATVSAGREWPCGEGRAPLGTVIMLMAEDDAGDTIIPRLEVAKADLSRVHFVDVRNATTGCRQVDLLSDLETLERQIRRFGDVRLMIIDPITAFLKSTAAQRDAATRLRQLAANLGAAVIVVSHLIKTATKSALTQVTGSLGLVAVARAVFIVAQEQGTDRRLFLPAKNNLANARTGLAYRIEAKATSEGKTSSALVWHTSPVLTSADEALASASGQTKQPPALTDAEDFLRLLLGSGPMAAKAIRSEASEAGVSVASLRRAARTLEVKSRRVGGLANKGHWIWELPDGSQAHGAATRALADMPFGGAE